MNDYIIKIEGDIEGYVDRTLLIDPKFYTDCANRAEVIKDIKSQIDFGDIDVTYENLEAIIPETFWKDLERLKDINKDTGVSNNIYIDYE